MTTDNNDKNCFINSSNIMLQTEFSPCYTLLSVIIIIVYYARSST